MIEKEDWESGPAGQLVAPDLDAAVDAAGRRGGAVVAQFVAAAGAWPRGAVEVAIEFLVPPASFGKFTADLDNELAGRVTAYAAARRRGELPPILVEAVPPGTFHQWRVAWRKSEQWQRDNRWSAVRELLDGVLRQARTGWRELFLA